MGFLSGITRGLKKLADPLGIVNKKNRIDVKNWKDPLNFFTEPSGSKGGGAGGVAGAMMPGGDRANVAPSNQMQNMFAQQLPQMLGNQALFNNPAAAQFLAQSMGAQVPQWAGGPQAAQAPPPGQQMPGGNVFQPVAEQTQMSSQFNPLFGGPTMYAGGTPNFDESANPGPFPSFGGSQQSPWANIFAQAVQGQQPGPAPDPASILARFRGTLGNGGGVTMPTTWRNRLANYR